MAKLRAVLEVEFEGAKWMPEDALIAALQRATAQMQSAIEQGVPAGVSTGILKNSVKILVHMPMIS